MGLLRLTEVGLKGWTGWRMVKCTVCISLLRSHLWNVAHQVPFFAFCLVFSNINCLFLRLLMFVSLGWSEGLQYYVYIFTFSAKDTHTHTHVSENATEYFLFTCFNCVYLSNRTEPGKKWWRFRLGGKKINTLYCSVVGQALYMQQLLKSNGKCPNNGHPDCLSPTTVYYLLATSLYVCSFFDTNR